MFDGRYDRLATQIQRRINELEAELTEARDAAERTGTDLEKIQSGTTWSQRSWFFSWVRNDREAYDRMRPLRAEAKRLARTVDELDTARRTKEAEINQVVHDGLAKHHSGYRDLLAELTKVRAARGMCTTLRNMADTTHRRIGVARATAMPHLRDEESRAATDRDAADVSRHVREVGQLLGRASHDLRAYGSLHGYVRKLNTSFSGHRADYGIRIRELKTAERLFESLGRDLKSILDNIAEQEMTIDGQLVDIRDEARDSFT